MKLMEEYSNTKMLPLVLVISAVSIRAVVSNDVAEICNLECPVNAPCRFGHADFSGRVEVGRVGAETHRNGMHCDCPIGWTGLLCDKKYETCSNQDGHECYNGGQCILGLQDKYGNEQLFCDCSNADGYVGKYCETPFEQKCNVDDPNIFCVNGGECNPNFPESSSQPCFCEDGYEGFHCEFEKGAVPKCTLDCQNLGVCFVGLDKPYRWSLTEDPSEEHMSCVCPPGFGGRLCEAPAEQCGNNNSDVCLNGGKCITTSKANADGSVISQHHCDCSMATNDNNDRFDGKFCEHKATTTCSDDDWDLFCTQGGTCKNNPIEGCSCPNGTAGYKCEFIADNFETSMVSDDIDNVKNEEPDEPNPNQDNISTQMEPCDKEYCLNGGRCVTVKTILEDGSSETEEHCDCSEAFDQTSRFAGQYCQYKSTSECLVPDLINQNVMNEYFCVHNGLCQEDGSCKCPQGWVGQYCELKAHESTSDLGEVTGTSPVVEDQDVFFGVDACGDSVCYNGGVCVTTEKLDENGDLATDSHCDCSTAYDDQYLFAGESCEFPSTQLCFVPNDGDGLKGSTFCTNHGACMDDANLGCSCPQGFYGFSCEFETRKSADNKDKINEKEDYIQDENVGKPNDIESKISGIEVCGEGTCYHGGKCIKTISRNVQTNTIETSYSCDCSTAFEKDIAYLGSSCEYPSTDFCTPVRNTEPISSAHFCVNHGVCKDNPTDGCECGDGFTGKYCEFKIELNDFDQVNSYQSIEECGGTLCLNGGKCVTSVETDNEGKTTEMRSCDCGSSSPGGDLFAGVSCEHKASSICKTAAETSFCVNGGVCRNDGSCKCSSAWKGDRCEFHVTDEDTKEADSQSGEEETCTLDCRNGGICTLGAKDLSDLRDTIGDVAHLNKTQAEDQLAHCVCPDGWIGLTCEHTVEVCGESEHICLHGSKCIQDSSSNQGYTCDCSQADDKVYGDEQYSIFAGDSCQYKQTDICIIGDDYPERPLYFCVNGGVCNDRVTSSKPEPGCTCQEGYTGTHCEVNMALAVMDDPLAKKTPSGATIAAAILILILVFLFLFCALFSYIFMGKAKPTPFRRTSNIQESTRSNGSSFPRRRRRKSTIRGSQNQNSPTSVMDPPPLDSDEEVDIPPSKLDYTENDDEIANEEFEDELSPGDLVMYGTRSYGLNSV